MSSDDRQEPRCPSCGYSLLGVVGMRCPECGRTLWVTDFDLTREQDRRDLKRLSRQGWIGVAACILVAVAVTIAAAAGAVSLLVAGFAWVIAVAAAGPKYWSDRYNSYERSLEDGWRLDKPREPRR